MLKSEGLRVILVNSNPATIMTDPEFADATYIEPITPEFVEKVIAKERPDALLATLGGQTALNTAMALDAAGVLERYGVELIGASIEAIERGENRESFKRIVEELGGKVARSVICNGDALGKDAPKQAKEKHALQVALDGAAHAGLPLRGPPQLHDGRHRLGHGLRRGGPAPHRRGRVWRRAPPPRCSWRSRSSAGRSTSWRSCATRPTTS